MYCFRVRIFYMVYFSFVSEPISQLFTISFQPLRPADTSPIFCVAKHRGGGRDFQASLFYYILVPFHFVGITFMYTYGNIGEWFVFVAGALSLLPCAALAV